MPIDKSNSLATQLDTLKTLSDIGREITSTLDMEKVLFTIYKKVNKLMDATIFGIGLYQADKKQIEYQLAIAEHKKYKPYTRDTKDKNQFPVWCIEHKKPVFINDVSKEYKKYLKKNPVLKKELEDGTVEKSVQSILYQPIIVKKKIIGIITVQSYKKNAYSSYHLDVLQNIASYAGMAIENARHFQDIEEKVAERTVSVVRQQKEIERSHQNTKLLSNIGREIAASLSVKEILEKTYKNVNKLMDAASFGIALFNKEKNHLEFICNIEKGKPLPFHIVDIKKDNRPAAWCFNNQKEVFINDFLKDYKKYSLKMPKGALAGEFTHSIIYLPLTSKKKKIGVITIQSFERNAYTEYHLDILKNLAVYVVNALENARLYHDMESEVKSRTIEITKQKEEIEISYHNTKLLSDIGTEITSSLDLEHVLFTIYKKVNKLMDATIFGIGLYYPERKEIEYKLALAENKKYKPYTRDASNKNQFPVWCIDKRSPIFINNIDVEYKKFFKKNPIVGRELEDGTKEKTVKSLLYQPIIVKKKVVGILTVQSYHKNAYNLYHLDVLQSIASYAGMAIENAQHFKSIEEKVIERTADIVRKQKEIEQSHQNTKLLSNIGREIASSLSVKEIVEKIYKNVNELMDASSFGIAIFNKEKNLLDFIYNIEKGKALPFYSLDLEKDNRPATWCFKNQKELFINDYLKEYLKYNLNKPKALAGELSNSLIYLPLTSNNKQIGVITVQSFEQGAYTEYHLDILKNLAVYVVNAVENAQLYQNMESEVKLRTAEVIRQKEEIEKSYYNTKLLSDIGKEITASLSVEEIIGKVYKSLNTLMDASVFAIGIYQEEKNQICFPGDIEKGEKLPLCYEDLAEEGRASGWCFKNQKEMIINDFSKDYDNYFPGRKRLKPAAGEAPESLIYLPLSTPNKQLGVITVQSFKQNSYTRYHVDILQNLAIYAVIAVENAQLYENLKKRTEEIVIQKEEIEKSYRNTKLLSEIGQEITASLSVEEISQKVYKNVNTLMNASVFGIGILNEKEQRLDFPGVIEKGKKLPIGHHLLTEESRPSVWCFKNQKELVINDFQKDYATYFPGKERLAPVIGEKPESIIYVPLTTGNKKLGVITLQSFKQNAYTEYDLSILRNLAIYIVIALENARLYGNMEEEVKLRTAEIEKQKEELEKLSIVASETDNAVIIAGPEGEIQWVNAGFTRLTGYSLKELKEKRGNNLMDVSGNPKIKEIVKDCIEKRKFVVYELMNKTSDGRDIWFQTMLTPILGQDGNVRNLVAIDSDITKLKLIEMEMRSQNEIISEKNKHITDSINYAKRIQDAILPSYEVIKNILPESFVLFKPKDIVSGDFYWVTEKKGKLFFAVVDCTGHGVPGAFVSIIGHNGLYRALNEFGLTTPSEILDKLNELVEETFKQNNNEIQINDGMDIALCSYDKNTKTLEFAGANNPLYHISDGTLTEIKGDKQPIGAFDNRKKFTNYTLPLKDDDRIYVFSDGFADQFGGESGKKFKYNKFKELLLSIQKTPMKEQQTVLGDTISNWMEGFEQLDDICVIGVKV